MIDTKQPEALQIAATLETLDMDGAADAVRRLHARAQELERAVADEREACALLAEQAHPHDWAFIGAAIRARGAQGESNG